MDRLLNPGEVFAILITVHDSYQPVHIPTELDMSRYVYGSRSPMRYELVATVSTTSPVAYVRRNNEWGQVSPDTGDVTPTTMTEPIQAVYGNPDMFYYQRVHE